MDGDCEGSKCCKDHHSRLLQVVPASQRKRPAPVVSQTEFLATDTLFFFFCDVTILTVK